MNVFIYGGRNRFTATQQVTPFNEQVLIGKEYSIDATLGFLVVAYPDLETETEFEFNYRLDYFTGENWVNMILTWDFTPEGGQTVYIVFWVVVGSVLCLILLICICIFKMLFSSKTRVQALDEQIPMTTFNPGNDGNNTSIHPEEASEEIDKHSRDNVFRASKISHGKQYNQANNIDTQPNILD